MDNYMAAMAIVQHLEDMKEPKPLLNATSLLYAAFMVADDKELQYLMAAFPEETALIEKAALNLIKTLRERTEARKNILHLMALAHKDN